MALLPRQPQEKYERCMLGNVSLLGSAAPTGRCGEKVSRKVTQLLASWVLLLRLHSELGEKL